MSTKITIPVTDLQPGDRFIDPETGYPHYTVIRVLDEASVIAVAVRFRDGGTGQRIWDEPGTKITVEREQA